MRSEDSVSTKSDPVTTFFWWYMAPLYESGNAFEELQMRLSYETPHLDREDLAKALDLLHKTVESLPAEPPPVAHERPAGGATPGRRRQRTEA